ncbi:hypothetical protein [Nocardioides sp. zg-DK7169]|uniref:hypothetical protein n=1 Tax=Nocardioides sp. zg-DK7169 TaxID=2736600 RepID=UPI001556E972|nr:hypothetical protein [Nocardioides sp. zg-DK7169]NPC98479.1 hypothetical protein [Nocardioides sp. zg-DK7169]
MRIASGRGAALGVALVLLVAGTLSAAGTRDAASAAGAHAPVSTPASATDLHRANVGTRARPAPPPPAARSTPIRKVQRLKLHWKGTQRTRRMTRAAVVPGIGRLSVVCRPRSTMVRLWAEDRTAETQMWLAKYETKGGHAVVATKTARVYTYADADDPGRGGTGAMAHEGLNQRPRPENFSSGHLDGIISQRRGRHLPASGAATPPSTSLSLNWWWTGFRNPRSWQQCRVDAVLTTRLDIQPGINWHGDEDGIAGGGTRTWRLPNLGELEVRCEPYPAGDRQTIALVPARRPARAWVETVTGEGRLEHHVEGESHARDPVTGRLGRFPLPRNGIMRLFLTVGGVERVLVVSSYHVTNNQRRPELNTCEVAVAFA